MVGILPFSQFSTRAIEIFKSIYSPKKLSLRELLETTLYSPFYFSLNDQALAQKAGISHETLRKNIQRKTLNADTLIRLLLARGITLKTLSNLPQLDLSKISKGESEWVQLGHELTEAEKLEFANLVRYIRSRWNLEK